MDKANLRKLRDYLAALPPKRFDMSTWHNITANLTTGEFEHTCGTAACIGGWADIVLRPANTRLHDTSIYHPTVGTYALMGLTEDQGDQLCFPSSAEGSGWPPEIETYRHVTLADAVTTLDKLIETGKVDWSHVKL